MRDSRVDGCGDSPQQTPEAAVEYGPEIEIRGDHRRIRATRHGGLQQGLCRGDTQSLGDVMTVWRDRGRGDGPEAADRRGWERGPRMVGHIRLQVREVAAGTRSLPIGGSRWFQGHCEGYERASESSDRMFVVGVSDARCLMPIGDEPQSDAEGM